MTWQHVSFPALYCMHTVYCTISSRTNLTYVHRHLVGCWTAHVALQTFQQPLAFINYRNHPRLAPDLLSKRCIRAASHRYAHARVQTWEKEAREVMKFIGSRWNIHKQVCMCECACNAVHTCAPVETHILSFKLRPVCLWYIQKVNAETCMVTSTHILYHELIFRLLENQNEMFGSFIVRFLPASCFWVGIGAWKMSSPCSRSCRASFAAMGNW